MSGNEDRSTVWAASVEAAIDRITSETEGEAVVEVHDHSGQSCEGGFCSPRVLHVPPADTRYLHRWIREVYAYARLGL